MRLNDHGNNNSLGNIFNLLQELESFEFEKNMSISSGSEVISFNEDKFFRSSSVDYFRGSIMSNTGENLELLNEFDEFKGRMTSKNNFTPQDFRIICTIGSGAYSKVLKAKNKKTNEVYAIKVIDKHFMEKMKKYYQIYVENKILNMCSNLNIIKIFGFYEDEYNVYLVLEYCDKGDLADFITKYAPLEIQLAKFIIAQILIMIEYLEKVNVVHRDFKPDNIIINNIFTLKLIDFGTATLKDKIFDEDKLIFVDQDTFMKDIVKREDSDSDSGSLCGNSSSDLEDKQIKEQKITINEEESIGIEEINLNRSSEKIFASRLIQEESKKRMEIYKRQHFVGTAEYMAPEVIQNREIGVYTDLWSLGCIIYNCFMGHSPFVDKTEYLIFQNILNLKYSIDKKKVPEDAQDLIENLLKLDPQERLGSGLTQGNTIQKLKEHRFFEGFDSDACKNLIERFLNNKDIEKEQPFEKIEKTEKIKEKKETVNTEVILKVGELKKKSPWFYYDKRKIVLYSTPRVDYIDPISNLVKGSILLTKQCKAVLIDNCTFLLKTPNRDYTFMCKTKYDISPWVLAINNAIDLYAII